MNRKKLLFVSSILAAIVGWSDPVTYTFTGSTGWIGNYGHDINSATDAKGAAMWSSGAAADPNCIYQFGKAWTVFTVGSASKFNGGGLIIANNGFMELLFGAGNDSLPTDCEIANLTVDAGAKFKIEERQWKWRTNNRNINGNSWMINGDLEVAVLSSLYRFYLNAPLSGSGTVTFSDAGGAFLNTYANQVLAADNSAYLGKFTVSLAHVSSDEANARGLEISQASALGGALVVPTPDALTLDSGSGLIATETLALDTANRGIDLKANAFFDVAAGKTFTIKEPIRSEGGFYKRGAGALALDSTITFGVDGTAEPDGVNSKLTVKEGTLRCVSTTATKDLDIVFGDDASLEIDPTTGTNGLVCRSLTFEGVLPVAVDFGSSYAAGAVVTVPLFTVPAAVAQNLISRIDVRAKGSSMASTLTLSESSEDLVKIATTLTVPGETKIVIRDAAVSWGTQINAQKDKDGYFLWSDNQAVQSDCAYSIPYGKWYQMTVTTSETRFNGKSLDASNGAVVDLDVQGAGCEIKSFSVSQNAIFKFKHTWSGTRTLTGDCWTVDGTLRIQPYSDNLTSRFNLLVPLTGYGQVEWMGAATWTDGGAVNQGLFADNGSYHGKFFVNLPLAKTGGADSEHARGIEIDRAESLGGALNNPTPDALTLNSWNGLIAKETLTLNAANRGIDLKANAFFEVASGKTMTIAEPIRSEGGFFKRGAGTLAFGASDVTFGEDGAAAADGVNNAFRVAAGAVRPTGKLGLGKLKTTFAEGAALEIDAFKSDLAVAADGFYQPLGWTVESGKLNVNIIFPDGYELEHEKTIVLATVPQASAQALADNMKINQIGLAHRRSKKIVVEPAGEGLAKIVLTLFRGGLILVVQ